MRGDRSGSGASAFRVFVQGLPDEIARARERGQPITCPDPGTEHGRALLRTLGVEIVTVSATAAAAEVERYWCPSCEQEVLVNTLRKRCVWCASDVQPLSRGGTMATVAAASPTEARTATCKVENCNQPAVQQKGALAGLCETHREVKRSAMARVTRTSQPLPGRKFEQQIRALLEPAKRLDKATAKLARIPEQRDPRTELRDALEAAQREHSQQTLDRVEKAIKRARKPNGGGIARRQKAESELQEAERALKGAVATLARELARS